MLFHTEKQEHFKRNKWSKYFHIRPHGRSTRTVQSYAAGGVNVHPPLTNASLGPPESTCRTGSRSVQPFLYRSRQTVLILYVTFPNQNCPFAWGFGPPPNLWFLGLTRVHTKRHLNRFSSFCTAHDRDRPRETDHATRSVTIGRIYVCRCGLKIFENILSRGVARNSF